MLTQSTKYLLIALGVVVVFLIMLNSGAESSIPTSTPPSLPPTRPPKTRPTPNKDTNPLIVDPLSKENADFVNNYITQQQIDDALKKIGSVLTKHLESKQPVSTKTCTIVSYGSGNGEHTLCEINPNNCAFLSFGINRDYSFDKQLVDEGCRGAGFDPSDLASDYKARLQKNLLFMAIGANSLDSVPSDWVMSSVPNLAQLFNMHKMAVLKMDCEGCEYALARDIIIEDPYFFHRVEQFAVEIHVGRFLMKTKEHMHNYGRLLHLLIDAGLELQDASLASCSGEDEAKGCYPGLTELGYPCDKGLMCQNLLFARRV